MVEQVEGRLDITLYSGMSLCTQNKNPGMGIFKNFSDGF